MFLVVGRGARYRRIDAIGAALAQPATQPGRVLTAADRIIVPHESSENGRKRFKRKVAQRNITSCNKCLHSETRTMMSPQHQLQQPKRQQKAKNRVRIVSRHVLSRVKTGPPPTYLHPNRSTSQPCVACIGRQDGKIRSHDTNNAHQSRSSTTLGYIHYCVCWQAIIPKRWNISLKASLIICDINFKV